MAAATATPSDLEESCEIPAPATEVPSGSDETVRKGFSNLDQAQWDTMIKMIFFLIVVRQISLSTLSDFTYNVNDKVSVYLMKKSSLIELSGVSILAVFSWVADLHGVVYTLKILGIAYIITLFSLFALFVSNAKSNLNIEDQFIATHLIAVSLAVLERLNFHSLEWYTVIISRELIYRKLHDRIEKFVIFLFVVKLITRVITIALTYGLRRLFNFNHIAYIVIQILFAGSYYAVLIMLGKHPLRKGNAIPVIKKVYFGYVNDCKRKIFCCCFRTYTGSVTKVSKSVRRSYKFLFLVITLIIPHAAITYLWNLWPILISVSGRLSPEYSVEFQETVYYFLIVINIPLFYFHLVPGILNVLKIPATNLQYILVFYFMIIISFLSTWLVTNAIRENSQYPEYNNSHLVFYNGMNSSVTISSAWFNETEIKPGRFSRRIIKTEGKSHNIVTISTHTYKYTKTIYADEWESLTYIISDVGCIKATNYDPLRSEWVVSKKHEARILLVDAIITPHDLTIEDSRGIAFSVENLAFSERTHLLVKSGENYTIMVHAKTNNTHLHTFATSELKENAVYTAFAHGDFAKSNVNVTIGMIIKPIGISEVYIWISIYLTSAASSLEFVVPTFILVNKCHRSIFCIFLSFWIFSRYPMASIFAVFPNAYRISLFAFPIGMAAIMLNFLLFSRSVFE